MTKSNNKTTATVLALLVSISIAVVSLVSSVSNKNQLETYTAKYRQSVEQSNTNYEALEASKMQFNAESNKLMVARKTITKANSDIATLEGKVTVNENVIASQDSTLSKNSYSIKILQDSYKTVIKKYYAEYDKATAQAQEIAQLKATIKLRNNRVTELVVANKYLKATQNVKKK